MLEFKLSVLVQRWTSYLIPESTAPSYLAWNLIWKHNCCYNSCHSYRNAIKSIILITDKQKPKWEEPVVVISFTSSVCSPIQCVIYRGCWSQTGLCCCFTVFSNNEWSKNFLGRHPLFHTIKQTRFVNYNGFSRLLVSRFQRSIRKWIHRK